MPTSPTSQSALKSGAAKDDTVGLNGDFNFTITDLLDNDPGGAAKVNVGTQFFFGDIAPVGGGLPSLAVQTAYLAAHGITAHVANGAFVSFDIGLGATDFNYFVQIGNKGTWSQAHVDVTAPEPHGGNNLFVENFDGYAHTPPFAVVDLNAASGWVGAQNSELHADGYSDIADTSPGTVDAYWLDTQNSPGPISISHEFTDLTGPVGGKTAVLSFDIAKESLLYNGTTHYSTDPAGVFQFKIDGVVVQEVKASDLPADNTMVHFDVNIAAYADNVDNTHVLELVDATTTANMYVGFAIDSIKIQDWIV